MKATITLLNAQVPGYSGTYNLRLEGGILQSLTSGPLPGPGLDLQGDWVSLGGVDLQINGALGLAFPELDWDQADQLTRVATFLYQQGVDAFLPTLVTAPVPKIHRALEVLSHHRGGPGQAQVLGAHLEGPFLNPAKRGAHPQAYLLPFNQDQVDWLLGSFAAQVRLITLAPELDSTQTLIPYLRQRGILVSLGHSQATAPQATAAFDQGATLVTHAFNAMPGLHHRDPGLLAAAILDPRVSCGLIADGQHVDPLMVKLLLRASTGDQGVFLVSDALAPLGLGEGDYPWDQRVVQVRQGTARLGDGILAGTVLPLLAGVENLVRWGACDVGTAIALATEAPRRALGLGGLRVGQPVERLLRWRWQPAPQTLTWEPLPW